MSAEVNTTQSNTDAELPTIDVEATLRGKNLIVIGTTGFLGKVWVSMLLHRYPDIGKLYTIVRPKKNLDSEARFWTEIAPSLVFDPLREQYPGKAYEDFMREKIVPVAGDVANPLLGLGEAFVAENAGKIDAIVNVAGVVDFNPPLDESLKVNAFGAQNLIELATKLGDVPLMHTSTCFVVGARDGLTLERNPLEFPFPRADELDPSHWDAEREVAECVDIVEQARRRVEDAPRQSHLLDDAKRNLKRRNEPTQGQALKDELADVKRKFVRKMLVDAGKERAQFWGWPNIYTYTKSIGEQVLLRSGLPVTIVRPAIVESALEFPKAGWCEGISTSSPIMFLVYAGQQHIPISDKCFYDAIPVDQCSAGMIASLAALLRREHEPVYQYCSADLNPLKTKRAGEMIGLAKRRYYKSKSGGNHLVNLLQAHFEPALVSRETFRKRSAPTVAKRVRGLSSLLSKVEKTAAGHLARNARGKLDKFARQTENIAMVFEEFMPFITGNEYRFSAKNTRALMARLEEKDRERLPWNPQGIDWRDYWMNTHHQGVEKWSLPLLRDKLRKELKPARSHDHLVAMLQDLCERHEHAVAMQRLEGDTLSRISYRDIDERSMAVAKRLHQAGVSKGDRVALGGRNHPDWGINYFGIIRSGAVAVPVDRDYEADNLRNVLEASKSKVLIADDALVAIEDGPCPRWDMHESAAPESGDQALPQLPELPEIEINGDDLASILYTSGTTGTPKGVMLSHANFTALVASLAPLFPIDRHDRLLSVLPLHHTFEFTCGFLLPFSRGARIIYLDEINGERLAAGLDHGKVSAMVGVPALWELLERRILGKIKDQGAAAEFVFDRMMDFNRNLGRALGFDLGRVLFGPVHRGLGGNLRILISGAASLPPEIQKTFQGLGLHIAEGYGLTEAAPVLTVARASARNKGGNVGRAIPGVEVKIDNPNEKGVGEVIARGPNVMKGYADNPEATAQSLDGEWLRTGDLGRIDDKDRLHIVGRSKEVILSTSGENVYPDDVEAMLGSIEHIKELSIVGLPDPKGGERVTCVAVPGDPDADDDTKENEGDAMPRKERHRKADSALRKAIDGLPRVMRPTVILLSDAPLPRTATRKVKRKEVIAFAERLRKAQEAAQTARIAHAGSGHSGSAVVREAVAAIAKKKVSEIHPALSFTDDLGFDSLMVVELLSSLESAIPGLPVEEVQVCRTVGEVEEVLSKRRAQPPKSSRTQTIERDEDEEIELPDFLRDPAKALLTQGQLGFYERVMQVKVRGKANIPQGRQTIVIANHASHLDMGLVKYALGNYGSELVALAAADYFFRSKWARTYVENFTNMAPLDRRSGLRKAIQQAGDHLGRGRTILIFPEGTRSEDGIMRDFMPLIGNLALSNQVDILPMYLGGTHRAFPKGSKIPVPRRRKVEVRIGPALRLEDLKPRTRGMKRADAYREVAKLAQRAVESLRDGKQLDLSREALPAPTKASTGNSSEEVASAPTPEAPKSPLAALFGELEGRFVPGSVEKKTSFYFSLGDGPDAKWCLDLEAERCHFRNGRPQGGKADCVLKTNPEIFTKIVRERYVPSMAEFMTGKVKSNDIGLLQVFQKAFELQG